MATLPGEIVLCNPFGRKPKPVPLSVEPAFKKSRLAVVPDVQAVAVSRCAGGAQVLVDFGGKTKTHVSLIPPRPQSSAVHDKAVLEVEIEVAPFSHKFDVDTEIRDSCISEVRTLVQETLTACVDVTAYPKTILTFRAVILETPGFSVGALVPALVVAATVALEKAEIATSGRALALNVPDSGLVGYDMKSGKVILLHASTLPEMQSVKNAVGELEKDLVSRGLLSAA